MRYVEIAMGVILVIVGVMLFTGIFEANRSKPVLLYFGFVKNNILIPIFVLSHHLPWL